MTDEPTPSPAGHRVVFLGASNVALAFPVVIEAARAGLEGPLDVLAAVGLGRSYGTWSRVLVRDLPSVLDCGLWSDPRFGDRSRPMKAFVTDIGNDLMYGASVPQIVAWVEECLARLAAHQADIVLTLLPLASVQTLSNWRYQMFRRLFFPGKGRPLPLVLSMARELNEEVRRLAERFRARLVEPDAAWYGLDPIHIRRAHRVQAWRHMLSHWSGYADTRPVPKLPLGDRWRLRRLRPAERRLLGRRQTAPQPALRRSGLTVSLY